MSGYMTLAVHQLVWLMDEAADAMLEREYGIGFKKWRVLMILKKQQPCSQAELARCLGLTPAGVTRFLPTYVEEGLVHSKVDSRQPRKNVLRLTPEGLAIAERCWAHLESEFATLLKECDVPVTEFVSFIDRLNEGLIAKQKGLKQ